MSDSAVDEAAAGTATSGLLAWLKQPNATFAAWILVIGAWALVMTILNLVWGLAAKGEQKVVWGSLLSMGLLFEDPYTPEMGFRVFSDGLFGVLAIVLLGWGAYAVNNTWDGGLKGWLTSLVASPLWPALVSAETDGGWRRTLAAWCLVTGLAFYLIWNAVWWRWTDPGVYAVTISLLAFGVALNWVQQAEAASPA